MAESTDDDRRSHQRDHEDERLIARETAQRLEREVEETARRVERVVEETAKRLEKGVEIALQAVATTALVHAEAHAKEHFAHERIHGVEKAQVDKAEVVLNKRLEAMNEFRSALSDAQKTYMTRESFDEKHERWGLRLTSLESFQQVHVGLAAHPGAAAQLPVVQDRLDALERRMDVEGGKREGISDTAKIAYTIVAALASLLSIAAIVIGFTR